MQTLKILFDDSGSWDWFLPVGDSAPMMEFSSPGRLAMLFVARDLEALLSVPWAVEAKWFRNLKNGLFIVSRL